MNELALRIPGQEYERDVELIWHYCDASLPLLRLGGELAAKRFHKAVAQFRAQHRYGFCLMPWPEAEYASQALFLTPHADAGLAVGGDGILHSVFSAATVGIRHGFEGRQATPGDVLTNLAIHMGAVELNCFDNGFTRQFYERHGFQVSAAFGFDPKQAIPGWNYGVYGATEPDFLIMRLAEAK